MVVRRLGAQLVIVTAVVLRVALGVRIAKMDAFHGHAESETKLQGAVPDIESLEAPSAAREGLLLISERRWQDVGKPLSQCIRDARCRVPRKALRVILLRSTGSWFGGAED